MSTFKVICKADGDNWVQTTSGTKIITTSRFFGLIKTSRVVPVTSKSVPGPDKEEICIVTDDYISNSEKYYILAGYPYGGYNAKYFVRLDEFTETQKDIAEKSEPILN